MSDPWNRKPGGADPFGDGRGPGGFEEILGALGGGRGGAEGLDGVLNQLRAAGFGPQLDSWIGTGANAPVGPEEMRQTFGDDRLRALGDRMGMGGGALAAILAQLLPLLIDRLSPQGRMPRNDAELGAQGGGLGEILGGILGGGGLGSVLGGILGGGMPGGPGEEVAPRPERGRQGKPSAGWPDQDEVAGGHPGKPGYAGKPGWPPQPAPEAGGEGGSDDPLGDLARSADRLRRR